MAAAKGPPPKAPKVDLDDLVRRWEADRKSRLFLQLAEEYRRQDSVDAALSVLKEGLKHHPTFVPARVSYARCLFAKGQLAQAQAELDPIVKKSADNLLAAKLLSEVLQARGERQRALMVLERAAPFAPEDAEVAERLAVLRAALGGATPVPGSSGDTAEFATGDYAAETTSGATAGAKSPPKPPPPPVASLMAAAVAPPVREGVAPPVRGPAPPPFPSPTPARPPVVEPQDDDSAFAIDADGEDATSDDARDADVFELEADEVDSDVPMPAPPPMPRPAEPLTEDLLGPARGTAEPGADDDFTSLTLAELYETQGAYAEALVLYERLLQRRPDDAELRRSVERCRARAEGRDVTSLRDPSPATPPARPRWTPVRSRQATSEAPPETPASLGAPSAAIPAPFPGTSAERTGGDGTDRTAVPQPATAGPRALAEAGRNQAERLRRTRRELERWLAAARAVRQ